MRTSDSSSNRPRDPVEARPDTAGGFAALLESWAAEARVDEAATERGREYWLARQAQAEATFAGTLLDLAERGDPVLVVSTTRRRHRGHLLVVTASFCLIREETGAEVLLRHRAIAQVRAGRGPGGTAIGDRTTPPSPGFADALSAAADERCRGLVICRGAADPVSGTLASVGRDVVTIMLDDSDEVAQVPTDAVDEVIISQR